MGVWGVILDLFLRSLQSFLLANGNEAVAAAEKTGAGAFFFED